MRGDFSYMATESVCESLAELSITTRLAKENQELRAQRDRLKAVLVQLATRFKHGDAPENCHCTGCVIAVALREVGE